jgi:hypothetical protein
VEIGGGKREEAGGRHQDLDKGKEMVGTKGGGNNEGKLTGKKPQDRDGGGSKGKEEGASPKKEREGEEGQGGGKKGKEGGKQEGGRRKEKEGDREEKGRREEEGGGREDLIDYTKLPHLVDQKCLLLDEDSSLCPTHLKVGHRWSRLSRSLLSPSPHSPSPTRIPSPLPSEAQDAERASAFSLLDALSRSGSLSLDDAAFHVFLVATNKFPESLVDTLIKDNVNPVEKMERGMLIMMTAVHGREAGGERGMVRGRMEGEVKKYSPGLFL